MIREKTKNMSKKQVCFHQFYSVKRYEKNPILTPEIWPYRVSAVFNPAAIVFNNETLLLVRVEDYRGFSHLTIARSKDGKTDWRISPSPALEPDPVNHPEEEWGIEDPRIVRLDEKNEYAITYTAFSKYGPLVSLATTKDFEKFIRHGPIMPPDDKDASLFPRKFKDRWALLHRPIPAYIESKAHIWISYSPDLKYWGNHSIVLKAREQGWWDAFKVGLGSQPIELDDGWLIIYHGVKTTSSGGIYRLGLALLDLNDPHKVLWRGDEWIFGPQEEYEHMGNVSDVTFTCGAILDRESRELRIYYGAADTCVGLAIANIDEILEYIRACIFDKTVI